MSMCSIFLELFSSLNNRLLVQCQKFEIKTVFNNKVLIYLDFILVILLQSYFHQHFIVLNVLKPNIYYI